MSGGGVATRGVFGAQRRGVLPARVGGGDEVTGAVRALREVAAFAGVRRRREFAGVRGPRPNTTLSFPRRRRDVVVRERPLDDVRAVASSRGRNSRARVRAASGSACFTGRTRPATTRPSLSRTTTRRGMEMWTSPRRRRARTSATTSWRLSEPSARRALLWCRDSVPCASCCSTRPCCHPATRARARGTCSRLGARLRTRTRSSSNIASCDNRRPTYVFVVTRTSFVGIGFSAGRGVLP